HPPAKPSARNKSPWQCRSQSTPAPPNASGNPGCRRCANPGTRARQMPFPGRAPSTPKRSGGTFDRSPKPLSGFVPLQPWFLSFDDPSPAHHQVVLIKHARLARRDRTLGDMKPHGCAAVRGRPHSGGGARVVITDFGGHFDFRRRHFPGNPVAALDGKLATVQCRFGTDHDTIARSVQFDHIHRRRRTQPQTAALPDGVKLEAFVMTEHLAVEIDNFAAMLLRELRLLEEATVIVIRHETDFHALLLVGGLELALARDIARVRLRQLAEREESTRELLLSQ